MLPDIQQKTIDVLVKVVSICAKDPISIKDLLRRAESKATKKQLQVASQQIPSVGRSVEIQLHPNDLCNKPIASAPNPPYNLLTNLIQALQSQNDLCIQLRLAFLTTLLLQQIPGVWNPQAAYKMNPISLSMAFVKMPMWMNAMGPLHAVKKITNQCSHGTLALLTGLRPAARTQIQWSIVAKKIAPRMLDFATVRTSLEGTEELGKFKRLVSVGETGTVNLNPQAAEFVPGGVEEESEEEEHLEDGAVASDEKSVAEATQEPVKVETVRLRPVIAAIRVQPFYQSRRGTVTAVVCWLQAWVRNRKSRSKCTKTYNDIEFSEVVDGVRGWSKSMKLNPKIADQSHYRWWHLLYAPDIICQLTQALEKIAPLCRMQGNLDQEDKHHKQFSLAVLKETLAVASTLGDEILALVRVHNGNPVVDSVTVGKKSGGKGAAKVVAVVVRDDEEEELLTLKAMQKAAGKKCKKMKNSGW
ncbi:hypothetical protein HDU98_004740 [Podochytrium sp. JEL0797]|nr:hypothetical protein HDU98_004740 [Podochytrium sp. JEL0797]